MKLDWDTQVGHRVENFQDFGKWLVGTETRTYAYPGGDRYVTVHMEGRATREVIEAFDRGDDSVMPTYFYRVWTHLPDGSERYNVTAGLVPEEELRRSAAPVALAAWWWVASELEPVL